MMGWGYANEGGTNWFWMGSMMVFWIAVIGIGIWLVLRLTERSSNHLQPTQSPRFELDRRFASGEVSVKDYVEGRHLLESGSSSSDSKSAT